jgi:transposase
MANDTDTGAKERQQRGLVIAATSKITKRGNETWIVPSQSLNGKYAVTITTEGKECTCPDFELRKQPCKHIFAVQYVLFREQVTETKPDGTVTTTTTEAAKVRVTYGQPDWHAYNAAQTTEKDHFCRLLHELVANVPDLPQTGAGRRRTPLSDMIFAAAYKVYSGFSARRFMSDLRSAREQGLISRAPAYNTLFDVMQLEEITPILHEMVGTTAKPLATVESQFAVDSTGLGTECFYRHYSAKYGHDQMSRDYVKVHAMIGTKTNVITAVAITDRDANDGPQFPALVERTAESFNVVEVSADKAYSTLKNLATVEAIGATPYVPFKANSKPVAKKAIERSAMWARLWHFFQLNKDEFLPHYHRRSNVEATFSMIKRVIGDTLRSKTTVAQINEALLMVICHNIRCLIHEAYEMGFSPMLEQYACPAIPEAARQLVTE